MTNEMMGEVFQTLDDAQLADITGAGFGTECAKGAAAGAIGGAVAGPKGIFFGSILGCLGNMAAHAIDRRKK